MERRDLRIPQRGRQGYAAGRRSASMVAAVILAGLLWSAPEADATKVPSFGFGGPHLPCGGNCGGEFLNNSARGVAINETGAGGVGVGTVYAEDANFNNRFARIQSFDAEGEFIRAWGTNAIGPGAANDTGTGFEICDTEIGDSAEDCRGAELPEPGYGSGAGEFGSVLGGIAVDQSTGNVYVADIGGTGIGSNVANRRVQVFDAKGHFLRAWGKNVDATIPGTGFEICTAASGDICKAGEAGSEAGAFGSLSRLAAASIGMGVDSSGNVYVADPGNKRVQVFDSEGHISATETYPSFGFNKPSSLTAIPAGGAYVQGQEDMIYRLSPSLAVDGSFGSVAELGNGRHPLAIDSASGHLYVTLTGPIVGQVVYELDPATGALLKVHADANSGGIGIALNASGDRLYDSQFSRIGVYEEGPTLPVPASESVTEKGATKATLPGWVYPNGLEVSEPDGCRFEYLTRAERQENEGEEKNPFAGAQSEPCDKNASEIGTPIGPVEVQAEVTHLRPGTVYEFRLHAANANGHLESRSSSFETDVTVVTDDPLEAIRSEAATLSGSVNPADEPVLACRFEYGLSHFYGVPVPCGEYFDEGAGEWKALSDPPSELEGSSEIAVRTEIGGLHVGTLYHYRLLAVNGEAEEVPGEDVSFRTLGPAIEASWAEGVSESEATLKAEVNPEGEETVYRFEYGTAGPCSVNPCTGTPAPDGPVGSDEEAHTLNASLSGLAPGTTYHYRALVTSECEAAVQCVNGGPDLSFTTDAPILLDTGCSNQAHRTGPGAALPECRAYEMVSPPDKGGGEVAPGGGEVFGTGQAASNGARFAYISRKPFGDAAAGSLYSQYLASRGGEGWSSHGLNPPQGTTVFDPEFSVDYDLIWHFTAFSPDLCHALLEDDNLEPLDPAAIHGYTNVYLRDNCAPGVDTYRAVTLGGAPVWTNESLSYGERGLYPQPLSLSNNLSHIVFSAEAGLALNSDPKASAPGEGEHAEVYDLTGGELHLVSVLPGGSADPGESRVGSTRSHIAADGSVFRAVSNDGSRVFWTSNPSASGTLYARVDDALTIPVSATVSTGSPALYQVASVKGSRVLFLSGGGLWEFDVDQALASADPEEADPAAASPIAGRSGGVVGASEDLSYLYFTSREAIAESGANQFGDEALPGEWNLYVRHETGYGEVRVSFIAAIDAKDRTGLHQINGATTAGSAGSGIPDAQVSPDGRHLAFTSVRSLTGYDSADTASGDAASEAFVYDADAGKLSCVSCNPSGERPLQIGEELGVKVAAFVPDQSLSNYVRRALSSDGSRLFFEAYDALLPQDKNDALDVYEWEAAGTGGPHGCHVGDPNYLFRNDGCLSLISTGHSAADSEFLDASEDGSDVFIRTESSIDPRDPGQMDVYDARVEGGFPPPPPEAPECNGDACQAVPVVPPPASPPTAAPAGDGNLQEAGSAGRCTRVARRAQAFGRRARLLRRNAGRLARNGNRAKAQGLRSKARRFARAARRQSGHAKRCRARASRRAAR